jgi:hypothetical protein
MLKNESEVAIRVNPLIAFVARLPARYQNTIILINRAQIDQARNPKISHGVDDETNTGPRDPDRTRSSRR